MARKHACVRRGTEEVGTWAAGAARRVKGGLIFEAHRLWYHSTLGSRVTKKGIVMFQEFPSIYVSNKWRAGPPRGGQAQPGLAAMKAARFVAGLLVCFRDEHSAWREAGPPNHHDDTVISDQ